MGEEREEEKEEEEEANLVVVVDALGDAEVADDERRQGGAGGGDAAARALAVHGHVGASRRHRVLARLLQRPARRLGPVLAEHGQRVRRDDARRRHHVRLS